MPFGNVDGLCQVNTPSITVKCQVCSYVVGAEADIAMCSASGVVQDGVVWVVQVPFRPGEGRFLAVHIIAGIILTCGKAVQGRTRKGKQDEKGR
jgi:hypothetical protein